MRFGFAPPTKVVVFARYFSYIAELLGIILDNSCAFLGSNSLYSANIIQPFQYISGPYFLIYTISGLAFSHNYGSFSWQIFLYTPKYCQPFQQILVHFSRQFSYIHNFLAIHFSPFVFIFVANFPYILNLLAAIFINSCTNLGRFPLYVENSRSPQKSKKVKTCTPSKFLEY